MIYVEGMYVTVKRVGNCFPFIANNAGGKDFWTSWRSANVVSIVCCLMLQRMEPLPENQGLHKVATMVFLIIVLVGTSSSKFFPGQPRGSQSTLGAGLRGSQFADKTSASAQSFDW